MSRQRTLASVAEAAGVALHCGAHTRVRLCPAPVDWGRRFVVGGVEIPVAVDRVTDTQLATTLGHGPARVRTVEHLLSALLALGIDNLKIHVEGAEVPILDGGGAAWVDAIDSAGVVEQSAGALAVRMRSTVTVRDGERWARLEPADGLSIDLSIDHDHPAVGRQRLAMAVDAAAYRRDIAWARNFGFAQRVPALQRMGLVRGGSLDNAVVFDRDGVLNEGGLRSPDEPVRHKFLDAMGDLALMGPRLQGRLVANCPGPGLIVDLLRAVAADPDSWAIVRADA